MHVHGKILFFAKGFGFTYRGGIEIMVEVKKKRSVTKKSRREKKRKEQRKEKEKEKKHKGTPNSRRPSISL